MADDFVIKSVIVYISFDFLVFANVAGEKNCNIRLKLPEANRFVTFVSCIEKEIPSTWMFDLHVSICMVIRVLA